MSCKVKYIENNYRADHPILADRLTDIYHSVWKSITKSNLFRKYGEGNTATYLFSPAGTGQNKKQLELINKINKEFNAPEGKSLVRSKLTVAGNNSKVEVDVNPLAQQEWEKIAVQGTLFQKPTDTVSSKASPKTIAMVKDFLTRIGVDVKQMDKVVVNGVKVDANGAALITQKLVQVVEGKEEVALTEEAMHFAVEIIQQLDPKLFNKLLKEINSYNILNDVFREYGSDPNYQTADGKPDILKLKKEAIAKVLTETVINKNEGLTEKPELIAKAESWWQTIVNALKSLFQKSGFDQAAMQVLSGEFVGTVDELRDSENDVYLQKDKQQQIYDSIMDLKAKVVKKDDGYYVDGVKVLRRVTDLVSDWYDRRFKANDLTKSEFAKAVDDLKAEKGTAGHKDIEHAFEVFVDADGFLRTEPLNDDGYVSKLDPNDRTMYEMLKVNLKERLNSFPKENGGTRFMSEAIVYDPKRDLAGTIDFLAIEPDGKTNILDWKFMDLNVDKYDDIPWYKVNAWRLQMEQYKAILQNTYNVSPQDFKQTRMIPIKAFYSQGNAKTGDLPKLQSIKIGDVSVKAIQDDYLIPVGLEGEKTGNKKIDALIEKLNAVYKQISEKKALPSEKLSKAEQLNALFTAIRQLQMKGNVKPLLYQAKVLNKQIKTTIDNYNANWAGKDPKSFSEADMNVFQEEIETAQDALDMYTKLDSELRFLFTGDLSEEDKKIKEELRDTADDARDLQSDLNTVAEEFADTIIAGSVEVDNLLSPEKIIKGITRFFSSTTTLQLKGVEVLFKKANKAFGLASMDTLTETKRLQDLKEAYDKLAASKGLTIKNYFDLIKKKDSNELIDEFDSKFYKELRTKINDKDYAWIRENVDAQEFKKFLDEKLEEEYKRIDDKARIGTDEEINSAIVREKNDAKRKYDASTSESIGWLQYDLVKKFPDRSKWESNEWKELHKPDNKAALDFYNYIIEKNNEYKEIGYINKAEARTFLPYVRKGLMEKIIFGGNISLGEQFLRSISIDEGDVGFGKTNPLTGKPIDTIPTYFTREIEGEVSTDLFRTIALYNEMAIKYKYLSNIEAQARALVRVEKNKKAIATSVFGKTEYKDGVLQYTPDNNENTKLVEDMVKAIVYGQKYLQSDSFDQLLGKFGKFGEKINSKIGYKIFPENLEGRQVSINKVIDQLNNTFQLKALGLNVLSATSNLFGGTAQSIINSGKYFNPTDFIGTELWLAAGKMNGEDKKLVIGALEYFLPLTDNYNKEIAKKLSLSKLSQENIQEFLMVLMRNSDLHVQTVNFFSFLKNSIVEDGKIVNAREFLRATPEYANRYQGTAEQRKALEQKFEEDVKKLVEEKGVLKLGSVVNNEFVIPGVDRKSDSVLDVRRKVQSLTKDALGSLSEDDVRLINMSIYGKSFMMFKNWIPRLVDVRAGNLKYNSASDAYEWGRMRMVFRVMSEDLLGSLTNLTNSLQANDKGVEFMRTLFEKKKADYEKETGKELKMTEAEFMDLVRKNIKSQMIDVIFMLTLYGLFLGLKANAPDDDEDETVKNQYKFLLKASDKLKDEILYFYDPTSITSLVSSGIFPSISHITNYKTLVKNFMIENYAIAVGDEKLQEKNYVIKYLLRSFPVTSQAQGMLPMFFPDLAKDLGIKAQSQSGFLR
jgi:cytidylate kinase